MANFVENDHFSKWSKILTTQNLVKIQSEDEQNLTTLTVYIGSRETYRKKTDAETEKVFTSI